MGSKFLHVVLLALVAFTADAQERHYRALVIGNGAYPQKPLRWPGVNARLVAGRLKEVGYEVTTLENTTSQQLSQALARLRRNIRAGDVVLFYYAGRATRAREISSLVPIDDTGLSRIVGSRPGMPLSTLFDMLEHNRAAANFIVLDVLAEWPVFGVEIGKEWLAAIPPSTGRTVIVSGTGQGTGSVTSKLLHALERPTDSVAELSSELGGPRAGLKGIPRAPGSSAQGTGAGKEGQTPQTQAQPAQPGGTPQPPDTPSASAPGPTRFATIQAPAQVAAGVPFSVLVSLTTEKRSPEVAVGQVGPGTGMTAEGALNISAPCQTKCEFEVVLAGPGFDFGSGSNTVAIEMSANGDSTPARFSLRALQSGEAKLEASFWYKGAFVAKAARTVQVATQDEGKRPAIAN